jgi:uncharacterized protein (TIGR02646 family)
MIYLPKSNPAPTCLDLEKTKKSGDYNCGDVLERLQDDFKNKCYLCEDKEPHSINTEHFKPKKRYPDLKFDWNNLFYCCSHCNNIKLDKIEYDEILNCTVEADAVDTKIKYEIKPYPKEKAIITAIEVSEKVNNTIKLLDEVYNGTTVQKKIESANLRSKLLSEIREFQDLLFKYVDDGYDEDEKAEIKNEIIRHHLKPTSNFTAFKRWVIRENSFFNAEFAGYI